MKSYRQILSNSWIQQPVSCHTLAQTLGISLPSSVKVLLNKLEQPEVITLHADVTTPDGVPLGGWVEITLQSNGTYTFKGNMHASGIPSYHFGLQVFIKSPNGIVIAAFHEGKVFGFDTPGDRNNSWEDHQEAKRPEINLLWSSIRNNSHLEYLLHADISGVAGTLFDVLKIGLDAVAAYVISGPAGCIVVIGNELGSATGLAPASPGALAGVAVFGGMVYMFGTNMIIPAAISGIAVGHAINEALGFRSMNQEEIDFAKRIFADTLPFDRIRLTNLSHSGGRKFTFPNPLDGSILVNLGDALDNPNPVGYMESGYPAPGQVFIHELTHAWQIANTTFMPGMLCDAVIHRDYDYRDENNLLNTDWSNREWSSFNLEQQAHVVDDWFQAYFSDFNSLNALKDPAFHFISENIRAGRS